MNELNLQRSTFINLINALNVNHEYIYAEIIIRKNLIVALYSFDKIFDMIQCWYFNGTHGVKNFQELEMILIECGYE